MRANRSTLNRRTTLSSRVKPGSVASRWPSLVAAVWVAVAGAADLVRTYSCEIASGLPRSTPTKRSSTSYTSPQTGSCQRLARSSPPTAIRKVPAISSTSTPSEAARSRSISTCNSGFAFNV